MIYIYSFVILIATTFGAIAGLGGGVVIKPVLDAIGYHNASTISLYSSFAVFSMCIISIIKQMNKGFKLEIKTVFYISVGSCIGGICGSSILDILIRHFNNNDVKFLQALLLLITLIFILIYTLKSHKFKTVVVKHYCYTSV